MPQPGPQEGTGVHFFATCLGQSFFPRGALAAALVLEDAGFKPFFDERQTCCGQPAMNLGYREEARRLALATIRLYDGDDAPVVVPSGSCAAMMSVHYPGLFPEDSPERADADRFAARVVEWSRFLVDSGYTPPRAPGMLPAVTLHPSCHALRELGVRDEPRRLLQGAGYPLVDLPGAEECCGFGGAFSVALPEASGAIGRVKRDNVRKAAGAGASVVASLDSGCLMHMRGGDERASGCREGEGSCPRYRHVAELIAGVVRGRGPGAAVGRRSRGEPDASSS